VFENLSSANKQEEEEGIIHPELQSIFQVVKEEERVKTHPVFP